MFNFDKRTIYIITAVLFGIALMQYASDTSRLIALLLTAPGVLVAITFHEFAHGFAAYKLGDDKFGKEFLYTQLGQIITNMVMYTMLVNIGLGTFNLLPLPPLDGSKVIMPFLPFNAKQWFINNQYIFYIVFIIIYITGIASMIISPVINFIGNGILALAMMIFGL